MPTIITQFGQAAASIAASVGGYVEFLTLHFGAYATPRSMGEFLLFCIAAIVLVQMIRIAQQLTAVRALPTDMEAEIERLQRQVETLSGTVTLLRVEAGTPAPATPSAEEAA